MVIFGCHGYRIVENVSECFANFEWHKAFIKGREVIENVSQANRPFTSVSDEKVKETVPKNHHDGIWAIAEDPNIPNESTQHILVNVLGMKCVNAGIVPKDLNTINITF